MLNYTLYENGKIKSLIIETKGNFFPKKIIEYYDNDGFQIKIEKHYNDNIIFIDDTITNIKSYIFGDFICKYKCVEGYEFYYSIISVKNNQQIFTKTIYNCTCIFDYEDETEIHYIDGKISKIFSNSCITSFCNGIVCDILYYDKTQVNLVTCKNGRGSYLNIEFNDKSYYYYYKNVPIYSGIRHENTFIKYDTFIQCHMIDSKYNYKISLGDIPTIYQSKYYNNNVNYNYKMINSYRNDERYFIVPKIIN